MRVVLTILCMTAIGSGIGVFFGIRAPKVYPASALILNPGHASHPPRITGFRAEMVVYDLDLQNRWGTTLEQAASKVVDAVELKPTPEGLSVIVISPNYKDAPYIARTVARDLGTPEHEAALAAKWMKFGDITPAEAKDLSDQSKIEALLQDQARNAGFDSYAMVLSEAAKGNEKAFALSQNEDFSRRWSGLQNITKKLGFDLRPGMSILSSNNPVQWEPISEVQVSKAGKLAVPIGRIGGAAVGGLLVLALLRWKPNFLRPAPRAVPTPAATPASLQSIAPETNDDPW
jgi:hypothetical protein